MACDSCYVALNYPDLTKKTYSMGCNYCAARYMANRGEADVAMWQAYGIDLGEVNELRQQGELIDPELRKRKSK